MGYTSQLVTGYYGDITFNNVAYFQIVNGLTVTGWVDNDTYNKLFAVKETIVPETVEFEDIEWEEIEETKETNYLVSSLKQIVFGNFTDDITVLGTFGQVGLALTGLDFPCDIRDITADIASLTNGTFDGWQFAFDLVAFIPVVGAFKCTDEATLIYKSGDKIYMATKHVDEVVDFGKVLKLNPYDLVATHSQTLSKTKFSKLLEDIRKNGIQETIKYVEYNGQKYVVDGHHRLLAAKNLGLKEVPVEKVELPYASYKSINDLLWYE